MRLPYRVVGDYHVDRQEMYGQQCPQSTCTNSPKSFLRRRISLESNCNAECKRSESRRLRLVGNLSQVTYCGGYSGGVPPLPIPNREVKPAIADGTAPPGGRVGSCRSLKARLRDQPGLFVFVSIRSRRRCCSGCGRRMCGKSSRRCSRPGRASLPGSPPLGQGRIAAGL